MHGHPQGLNWNMEESDLDMAKKESHDYMSTHMAVVYSVHVKVAQNTV